ncbi:MAG: hypothetical protein L3J63_01920, partial [Geopsychrobacter sp.]|nr:hypothetical protein [Geopsychrobacter sp.]
MATPEWLPDLILLENFDGDWECFLNAIYEIFKTDFVTSKPIWRGRRLGLKRHPVSEGKEATFWHMISEGDDEKNREIDLWRCERIRWPRPVIEQSEEPEIKVWENRRRGETRICLWLESQEYLVILADRRGYLLPWTAYPVTRPHRKRKLQREYEEYRQKVG